MVFSCFSNMVYNLPNNLQLILLLIPSPQIYIFLLSFCATLNTILLCFYPYYSGSTSVTYHIYLTVTQYNATELTMKTQAV